MQPHTSRGIFIKEHIMLEETHNLLSKGNVCTSLQDELSWLQSILFFGMVLLFPHMGVCILCFKWLYIHPLICVPAILHCCIHTYTILRQLPLFFKTFSNQIR